MAFTEYDRVQIRLYMGASAIFAQLWPALENAIRLVQSNADGGDRPDDSTEILVKSIIAGLQAADARILDLQCTIESGKVDELAVDPVRGTLLVRSNARALVGRLSNTLGMRGPLADVFSARPANPVGIMGI